MVNQVPIKFNRKIIELQSTHEIRDALELLDGTWRVLRINP